MSSSPERTLPRRQAHELSLSPSHTHMRAPFAFVHTRQQMAAHYWADRVVIWQAPPLPLPPHPSEDTQRNAARMGHFLGGRVRSNT